MKIFSIFAYLARDIFNNHHKEQNSLYILYDIKNLEKIPYCYRKKIFKRVTYLKIGKRNRYIFSSLKAFRLLNFLIITIRRKSVLFRNRFSFV